MLHDRSKRKILVAEDDPGTRQLVAIRLDFAGYKMFQARNGNDAIAQLLTVRPNALILDLGLPFVDGFGVLKAMFEGRMMIPTLILTARHNAEDVQKAIGLGASDYLTKPCDDKDLLRRMDRLVVEGIKTARAAPDTTAFL